MSGGDGGFNAENIPEIDDNQYQLYGHQNRIKYLMKYIISVYNLTLNVQTLLNITFIAYLFTPPPTQIASANIYQEVDEPLLWGA